MTKPFRGETVDLVVPQSLNLPASWEVMVQEWSSQSGAAIRFVEYDGTENSLSQQVTKETSQAEFLLFPLNRLCEIDQKLDPKPMADGQSDTRDIFKGLRERVLTRERQVIASPISVPVLLCYFRHDLLRAAERKIPETWDEYHDLVESLNSWAPGLIAVEPLSPEFRATTFFARSLAYCKHPENYSTWFDIDTAKPTLTSPGFVKALEVAQRTWSKLPPEAATYSPSDCRRMLLSGKAAIGLTFEPLSGELVNRSSVDSSLPVQRIDGIELGICRLPGSKSVFNRNSKKWDAVPARTVHAPALCGFAGLAAGVIIPLNRKGEGAASNLLISLTSPALFDQAFASLPKCPCRESQVGQASTWFGPELSSEEASQYCDATALSLRDTQLVFELPLIGADEFRRATSSGLESIIEGKSDAEQTSNALQQSFEKIVEQHGWQAIRDSHRRGLGMPPAPKK